MSINAVRLIVKTDTLTPEDLIAALGTEAVEIKRKGDPVSPSSSTIRTDSSVSYHVVHGWPDEDEGRLGEFLTELEPLLDRLANSELQPELDISVWLAITGREQGNVIGFDASQLEVLTRANASLVIDTYTPTEDD